jgi:cyclic pyranopterin phosphate synthase
MLSHVDENNQPRMVDVGEKDATRRIARAQAIIALPDAVRNALRDGDFHTKKGPVFQTAIIAGVMAAKKTSELIPLCHPIGLDHCHITIEPNDRQELVVVCETSVTHKTGVEMEALTGATVAALTVYDMCKALSHDIVIKEVRLLEKRGGKSDYEV